MILWKSIIDLLLINMLRVETTRHRGVRLLDVQLSLNMMGRWITIVVQCVGSITVSSAKLSITME